MKERYKRIIAIFFALNILFEVVSPTIAFGLTGGPSQPEVQAFTPVSTSDMVNLFSGDFNYNIPLMDIDGYPVNLAYNAGISNDQEASWVGLGWNINPGTVNRGMRGLPDDFNGDKIHKEINMKANQTFGASFGVGLEFFGKDIKAPKDNVVGGLSLSVGLNYNTYNGYGIDMSAKPSLKLAGGNKSSLNASIGLNSGTGKGLGISANLSYQKNVEDKEKGNKTLNTKTNASLGLNYNSASGLGALTFDYSVSRQKTNIIKNSENEIISRSNGGKGTANGGFGYSFASPSYMPTSGVEMINLGMNLSITFGAETFGTHAKATIGAFYAGQFIKNKTKDYNGYGYLNSHNANNFGNAPASAGNLHDFNREKDASFTLNTPNLPVTNYSYDSFNYTGQGISGDFRPYRNHVGTVFDPYVKNYPSINGNVGIELGVGDIAHGGLNAELSFSRTKTGKWTTNNNSESNTIFYGGNSGFDETVYFKQGGEKEAETDMTYFNDVINGFQPVRLGLQVAGAEAFLTKDLTTKYNTTKTLSNSKRTARVRRNETVNVLTSDIASAVGLETSIKNYPSNYLASFYSALGQPVSTPRLSGTDKDHHISEITTLRDDGARYVYGIPAYNNIDKDVSFAVEPVTINYNTGLTSYFPGSDNSLNNNSKGLDHYFSSESMPAYAHAFLLTAVLSSDYVDRTQDGPTKDDLGKYTKFNYTKQLSDYKWRVPYGSNQASLNQALYSSSGSNGDDKASYNYGEKEIWYLQSIETKNYVAQFELQDRLDGIGVQGEDGGPDPNPARRLQSLKTISLYSKQELIDKGASAVPLKVVHFEYDYTLCNGVDNNQYFNNTNPNLLGEGKLTLKKVWFTYQNSQKGRLSPYVFGYNSNPVTNYNYNPKAYDRWGNYKANNVPTNFDATNPFVGSSTSNYLLTSEFPYSEQDPVQANLYASAWNLSSITLPSGGIIQVNYEADDYAYVQDKRAMQMFTLQGADAVMTSTLLSNGNAINKLFDTSPAVINDCMYLKLSPQDIQALNDYVTVTNQSQTQAIRNLFFRDENGSDIDYMYFKFLVNVQRNLSAYNPKYEYISGYAKINFSAAPVLYTFNSITYLVFKVVDVPVFDNIPLNVNTNPVSMAGINFVRKYMPRVAYDNDQDPTASGFSNLKALATAVKGAFTPLVQFFKGGISNALRLSKSCQEFVPAKSFVRLYSATQSKKGGGCRVKAVALSDNWSTQSGNPIITNADYGQTYDYVTKDGSGKTISSGVASYEPLIGGDENPFRQPVFYEEKNILAPDDDFYQEKPYGESMFPGPSVGYSRVVVRNLERTNSGIVSRHATGAMVSEFYTAKDFPTKVDKTDCDKERHKPNPVAKFLKFFVRDYMTTSQGYQIILNDMHGKPKAQWVYKEGDKDKLLGGYSIESYYGNNYISGIEYKYKRNLDQLTNDVTAIEKTGQISTAMVGVDYDMVNDTRESETITRNGTINGNLEGFLVAIFPALIPTVFPGYSQEKVRYRSSVVTKVLYRYGLIDEIIAHDNGASVSTQNKLWDAETGEVVLTETVNNFTDPIYNITYPSHWSYDRMGSSAKNISAQSIIMAGTIVDPSILIAGDEVLLYGTTNIKGWVKTAAPNVQIINNTGALVNLNNYGILAVIRSGNRNQQNIPVSKISSLVNPLVTSGNVTTLNLSKDSKVINASAAEFKDDWGTFCNCTTTSVSVINPYLTGQKGIFRPAASYVYLTGREQTKTNSNTNIRKDGPYTTFVPFWNPNNSSSPYNWNKTTDPTWQFTSKMSVYSPYGFETENQDALGRNSAAIYGYGYSLPIAVSSNSKFSQIGFDGFEDYDYNTPCEIDHFSYIQYFDGTNTIIYNKATNNYVSKTPTSQNQKFAHTGRKSIMVPVNAIIKVSAPVQGTCSPNPNTPIIY